MNNLHIQMNNLHIQMRSNEQFTYSNEVNTSRQVGVLPQKTTHKDEQCLYILNTYNINELNYA